MRVGDLGLSTARAADDAASKGRSVLGTPEFMAPELYDEAYDEKVDVYAFGMCALEMITKQLPYAECRNATQIYKKVQADVPPDALALVPDERAAAFVRLCVRRDPAARPSASELLAHPFLVPDPAFGETEVKLLAPPRTPRPSPSARARRARRLWTRRAPRTAAAPAAVRTATGRRRRPPPPRPARTAPRRRRRPSVRVAQSLASSAALDSPARPASPRPPHDEEADDDAFIANMPSSETSMKDVENRVREGRRRREDDADAAAAAAATAREGRDASRGARGARRPTRRDRARRTARRPASTAGGGLSRASSAVSLDGAAVATDMGPPAPRAPRGGSSDPGGPPPRADSRRARRRGRRRRASTPRDPTRRSRRAARRRPSPVGRTGPWRAPPPRFRMRPSTKPVGALSDGAVSVNILSRSTA